MVDEKSEQLRKIKEVLDTGKHKVIGYKYYLFGKWLIMTKENLYSDEKKVK